MAVGENPKYLTGNARLSGKKPFLFSVYLSVWEQMHDLSLMFSHPTVSESTIRQCSVEKFRPKHARPGGLFTFSSLKPGEFWLSVGEGNEKKRGHGPSHPLWHSWVLIKEENIGSDILDLQDPNAF